MDRVSSIPVTALATVLLAGCGESGEPAGPSQAAARAPRGGGAANTAPSNLTATADSPTQITLGWQDNSTGEIWFEVHVSTSGSTGLFSFLTTLDANVTAYANSGLTPEASWCYKVRAVLAGGPKPKYSGFSNTACATTPPLPPPPPERPNMSGYTWPIERPGLGIEVVWTDGANNEDGFRIERAEHPDSSWAVVGTVGANITSFMTDLPLCYRVFAFNVAGSSSPSIPGCTAAAAPTNLTVTVVGGGIHELTWTDNSAVEDEYVVLYGWGGCGGSFDEVPIAQLPANSTSYRTAPVCGPFTHDYYLVAALKMGQGEMAYVEAP